MNPKQLAAATDLALQRYDLAKQAGDIRALDDAKLELRKLARDLVEVRTEAEVIGALKKALARTRSIGP